MARFTTSNIEIGMKLEPRSRKGSATIVDIVEDGKTLAKVAGNFTVKGIIKPFEFTLNMFMLNTLFKRAE